MDYQMDVEQTMLKDSVRDFFSKEFDIEMLRELEQDENGYNPKTWKKMAKNGWMGVLIPETYQGEEMTLLDMALILEEMGFSGFESPFFTSAVTSVLLLNAAGSDKQKKAILPKIATGKKIVTLAYLEPDSSDAIEAIQMKVSSNDDGEYLLNGTKMFVSYAHVADQIICAARTADSGSDGLGGITLFIVDSNTPGISVEVIDTIARNKLCCVTFDSVLCDESNILGAPNEGGAILFDVIQQSASAKCAEMAGGGRRILKMNIDYTQKRIQFGRPIGKFQAVQHHAANMLTFMDTARMMAYKTCWTVAQGEDCTYQTAVCKAWVSDAYRKLVALGHQILGGYGFMDEVEQQFFFRKAKAAELMFGDATFHREIVAKKVGL